MGIDVGGVASSINVNGSSVYALMQVDVAHISLPISMYIRPLRGSVGALQ